MFFARGKIYYDYGADCTTLSCIDSDNEYKQAIGFAHAQGKLVASDFCYIEQKGIAERMIQLDNLGCDIISFGTNVCYDIEGANYDNPTA